MANQICKFCEKEPAAFLISEISTGETVYVGVLCLPPFTVTVWEDAGMPALRIDVDEDAAQLADTEPGEAAQAPGEALPILDVHQDQDGATVVTVGVPEEWTGGPVEPEPFPAGEEAAEANGAKAVTKKAKATNDNV